VAHCAGVDVIESKAAIKEKFSAEFNVLFNRALVRFERWKTEGND
jgi:hypothetical protein